MRPVGVVLGPPALDNDLGLQQGAELLDVEQLVTYPAVEALDEGVPPTAIPAPCRPSPCPPGGTSRAEPTRSSPDP